MNHRVPFNVTYRVDREIDYVADAIRSGHTSSGGPYSNRCQRIMQELLGARRVLMTSSCTGALEMAALLAEVEPGDEVVLPSFTFVSSADAFYLRGARLVFVDVRREDMNLDTDQLDASIGDRTKVIVPVHYAGVSCEMDTILSLAVQHDAVVVEDAAHAFGATYRGRHLGTLGDMGTISFHATKNLSCGEGGALILNREELCERAEIVLDKGTNRAQFLRGQVDKYTWVDVGSSYGLSDVLAAALYAQLETVELVAVRRAEMHALYQDALAGLETEGFLERPRPLPKHCGSSHHLYHVLLADLETRQNLIEFLRQRGISAAFHYQSLHLSPMGRRLGYRRGELPVTESLSDRLLRLPFFYSLTDEQISYVCDAIGEFFAAGLGSPIS